MFIKYIVKHYSKNRKDIYSMFAFDKFNDAYLLYKRFCCVYEHTNDVISIYEFSYDDNMYFELTYTNL